MRLVEGIVEIDDLDEFLERIDGIAAEHGCSVQAFDARYVVGQEHLRRAVELADRAIERGENVARTRGVEILLYAAGRRQIDRALAMGVAEGRVPAVVLVDAPPATVRESDAAETPELTGADPEAAETAAATAIAEELEPATTLGEYDPERVREFFDIGDAELEAGAGDLSALVLERVALLDVEK